jgi:hypothetical protein
MLLSFRLLFHLLGIWQLLEIWKGLMILIRNFLISALWKTRCGKKLKERNDIYNYFFFQNKKKKNKSILNNFILSL